MGLILITLLAFILRLLGANQSFWLDEGSSIVFARLPIPSLFTAIQNDFHPPLFYLLLHYWLPLAGKSETLIRLPAIIFGVLTVPALYFLVKLFHFKEKMPLAMIAAFLLALNPFHVYYSQELRMYSLNTFLTVLSWLCLKKWLVDKQKHFPNLYFLVSLANLYTFYGAFFNLVAQWVYFIWQKRSLSKKFLIANTLLAVFYLPWLPTFLTQLKGGGYLVKALAGWSTLSGTISIKSIGLIFAKFTLGRISFSDKTIYLLFVASIMIYFGLAALIAWRRHHPRLLISWFTVPLLIGILVSLKTPVLGYWRYLMILPAFITLLTLGIVSLPKPVAILNLGAITIIFVIANVIFWQTPAFQRENWRQTADLINRSNALTIVNFPDVISPLKFYAPTAYYYPDQEKLGVLRRDLDLTLPALLAKNPHVLVLDYLSDLTDPRRRILTWLKEAGLTQVAVHNINGVGFIYEFKAP